jgi:hypothetical protein
LLDGLVRYRFGDNAELMGAWASARNVLGPFRSKAEPGVVKPAASGRRRLEARATDEHFVRFRPLGVKRQ